MALADNLISYWPLDESSGDAIDVHGSNTLSNYNGVGSGAGLIGNARNFVASSSQCFYKASNADLNAGDIDFTIQAWIKLVGEGFDNPVIMGKDDEASGNREYYFGYDKASNQVSFSVFKPTDAQIYLVATTFGAASLGVWYLMHGWHDATNNIVGVSVNAGSPDTVGSGGSLQAPGSALFIIGAREYSGFPGFWDGMITHCALWKRVLTSGERTELYNGGAGLAYPFTVAAGHPASKRMAGVRHAQQTSRNLSIW